MHLQPLTITVIVLGTCLAAFQPATGAEGASRGSPRRANAKKSSPSILLPEAGIYPAKKFFPLVKKLAGRAVKPTSKKISAKPVTISIEMAGQLAHFDELALLLAAVWLTMRESSQLQSTAVREPPRCGASYASAARRRARGARPTSWRVGLHANRCTLIRGRPERRSSWACARRTWALPACRS